MAQLQISNPFYAAGLLKPAASGGSFPSGLIHYWSLNETSGARDDSLSAIDLVDINAEPTDATSGVNGNAAIIEFGTSGANLMQATGTIDLVFPFTFAFWIQTKAALYDAENQAIISTTYDAVQDGMTFAFRTNAICFRPEYSPGVFEIVAPLTTNTWHMIVGTSDGTQSKLSIDGGAYSTSAATPDQSADYFALDFEDICGCAPVAAMAWTDAWMVFDHVLSDSEVSSLWNSGAGRFP